MMEIIGYLSLMLMGGILGMMGAGGAILTLPILVYCFQIPMVTAATYSFLIVGGSSLFAVARLRQNVHMVKALVFAIPSIMGVSIARRLILPNLPKIMLGISLNQWLIFALVFFMAAAGYFMVKSTQPKRDAHHHTSLKEYIGTAIYGLCVGIIIGILGASGGFLMIPTLVLALNLSMKEAVATSLCIIVLNSAVGFLSDPITLTQPQIIRIGTYLVCALVGMLIGLRFSHRIASHHLKKSFGYFVWGVATFMLLKECVIR